MGVTDGPSNATAPHHRRSLFDERVVPHRRRSRLRLRDWRMRTKLGAVLIVPSVAFIVLASVQTGSLVSQATVLNEFAEQVRVGRETTALIHELQQERDRTFGERMAPATSSDGRYDPAQARGILAPLHERVDGAVDAFRAAGDPMSRGDAAWRVAYARTVGLLDQLPALRSAAVGGIVTAPTIEGNYTRTIDSLLALLAEPSPGVERPELTDAVLRYVQLARVKEAGSRIRARLYSAGRVGGYGPEELVTLSDLRVQQLTAMAEFQVVATTEQLERYAAATRDPRFVHAGQLEETSLPSADAGPRVIPPASWWSASQDRHDLLREVETSVLDDAVEQADSRSAAQVRRTVLVAVGVLAVLLAALLTSVVIGRSIARSLRMLRAQALQVAQLDLPETLRQLREVNAGVPEIEVPPATVRSMDEIGDVAEAFVAVHRSAVTVAVDQATMRRTFNAMFVNLARRSQVLVERQLELLDELEREESDPDQLENLFKLDHLAARMRRNDESLLVLAGTESTRRWNRPVALSTVVLAAVAEIEQYPRVRHEVPDDLHVVGHAVADLVHMLAELLENATAFSPPDTLVRVTGTGYGPETALIEIVDEGLGMSPTGVADANKLLAAPPAADLAASERMGLFVVSHLAARQGVRVQLRAAERGVVATIWLPGSVLSPAPTARDAANDTGRRGGVAGGLRPYAIGGPAGLPALRAAESDRDRGREVPAGRRKTLPRSRRAVPTRSEDVLADATGAPEAPEGSTWWSRQARPGTAAAARSGAGRPAVDQPGPGHSGGPVATGPAPTTRPGGAVGVVRVVGQAPLRPAGQAGPGRTGAGAEPAPGAGHRPPPEPFRPTVVRNANGLPVRVPMAHLPSETEAAAPAAPRPHTDPDPDAAGSTLSRFYGGVRRAEAEETTEMSKLITRDEERQ
ncbi:sensor histidine kinase [Polymorphospora rubra]|uniref:histidine kinase n=1 Tax=Polymorphospora rubra TaxID=338584 RepID=A0A810MQU0_9ACTN|nr:nitrate- and nitrite sensing domain-containing protein [Polymorphospora rubra]BCJ63064.1 histidine kinase [Polymorphospora rubra]